MLWSIYIPSFAYSNLSTPAQDQTCGLSATFGALWTLAHMFTVFLTCYEYKLTKCLSKKQMRGTPLTPTSIPQGKRSLKNNKKELFWFSSTRWVSSLSRTLSIALQRGESWVSRVHPKTNVPLVFASFLRSSTTAKIT